ncbi:hypothetical protein PAXRUDRAFT_154098, partial [Paxillus rubicundulus Ve08.2h10]
LSLIMYGYMHNLCGIIASQHHPTSISHMLSRAQPLGGLAAHYLASHRYNVSKVNIIIHTYRCVVKNNKEFTMKLVWHGMAVDEVNFLLELIDM